MQYPAIWHSVFDQISLTKSLSEHGNELLDAGGFQQVNCSEAPINSKDFFGNKNRRYFELSIEPRTSLTISNISVGQLLNPQSSQGFSPLREPHNSFVLLSGNRKKQNT